MIKKTKRFLKNLIELFWRQFFKKVHKDMFNKIWNWAGKFRKTKTNIGSKPFQISIEIEQLCKDVHYWDCNQIYNLLEKSIRIHHRLVKIHPFVNGNGRHARFIADLYIHTNNGKSPHWPNDLSKNGNDRKRYIQSLKEADLGSYHSLYDFIISLGAKNKK